MMKSIYKQLFSLIVFFLFTKNIHSANRYWVGGTGTWNSSNTSNWSTSSGGASGASAPTSVDNVIFDASSGLSGNTVTAGSGATCANFTWSTSVGTLAFSSDLTVRGNFTWSGAGGTINGSSFNDLNIGGNYSINSSITLSGSFLTIVFNATSTGKTITTNGKSIPHSISFNGTGGSWTLSDALTTTSELELVAGTFNTNNYSLSVRQLNCYGYSSTTRQINLGSSTVTITPGSTYTTDVLNFNGSNLTVNAGTSTINITLTSGAEYYIDYNAKTLYNLTYSSAYAVIRTSGALSCNSLTLSSGNFYFIDSGTTHTISSTLTATGSCTNYITISSDTKGTNATILASGGAQSISNVVVIDITGSTNTITCTDCANATATDGTFSWTTPRSSRNLYWIGGTGNFNNPTEWSTTSGGANDVTCAPSAIDNVYFDANSFSGGSQTVTVNNFGMCNDIDWTGVTNTPNFYGSFVNLFIYGDLTFSSGMTSTSSYIDYYFYNNASPSLIDGKGIAMYGVNLAGGGTYTLESDLNVDGGGLSIASGSTLDVLPNGGIAGTDESNIDLAGSWSNYGTFTERSNNSAWVIFNGSSTSYMWTDETFNNLEINGSGTLQTYSSSVTISNELLVTAGTFKINPSFSAETVTCSNLCQINGGKLYLSSSNANLSLANDLDINGGTIEMDYGTTTITGNIDSDGGKIQMDGGTLTANGNSSIDGASLANSGELELNGGTVTIGNGTTEDIVIEGGFLDMNSGTLSIKGYLSLTAGTFDIADGTINLSTGATTGTPFSLTGGTYTLTGGTVDIKNVDSGGATNCINIAAGTTLGTISGGTVKISATNANALINVNSTRKLYHFENATTGRTITLASDFDLDGNYTLTNGTFNNGGYTIYVGGTWTYTAGTFTHSNNTVTFDGTSNQSITGATSTSFYNLTNSNSSTGLTLNQNITVTNTLSMSGAAADIDLNSYTIDLSSTGSISGESNTDRIFGTTGTITTTRDIGSPTSLNVGNMGCVLTSGTNMGSTTIIRGHAPQTGVNAHVGIDRYYSISPTTNTGLNATLEFYYFDDEITGHTEADLALYRSTDGGTTWTDRGGTVAAASNYVSLSSIDAFSMWTLSDQVATPLPVSLTKFDVLKTNEQTNIIQWETKSERNNSHFIIDKAENNAIFHQLTTTPGSGNSLIPINYEFIDYNIKPTINYYRLTQVDYDGSSTTFNNLIISVDNRLEEKNIIGKYNILGQKIDDNYKGVVIIQYDNGTNIKVIQ